jgi:hypothetical protein
MKGVFVNPIINREIRLPGPVTYVFGEGIIPSEEFVRSLRDLALIPNPQVSDILEKAEAMGYIKNASNISSADPTQIDPEPKPDFHPVDCPPQFPSEPE